MGLRHRNQKNTRKNPDLTLFSKGITGRDIVEFMKGKSTVSMRQISFQHTLPGDTIILGLRAKDTRFRDTEATIEIEYMEGMGPFPNGYTRRGRVILADGRKYVDAEVPRLISEGATLYIDGALSIVPEFHEMAFRDARSVVTGFYRLYSTDYAINEILWHRDPECPMNIRETSVFQGARSRLEGLVLPVRI